MKTEEVQPKCCYARPGEEGTAVGNVTGQRTRAGVVNGESLARPVPSSPLGSAPSESEGCPFLQGLGEHLSGEGLMTCLRTRSEGSSCTRSFPNSFGLKQSVCEGPYFGVMCLEPHQSLGWVQLLFHYILIKAQGDSALEFLHV